MYARSGRREINVSLLLRKIKLLLRVVRNWPKADSQNRLWRARNVPIAVARPQKRIKLSVLILRIHLSEVTVVPVDYETAKHLLRVNAVAHWKDNALLVLRRCAKEVE